MAGFDGAEMDPTALVASTSSSEVVRDLSNRSLSPILSSKCPDGNLICSGLFALLLGLLIAGVALGEMSISDE